jgi:exodeoxyribonuclease V alpha subunit
MNIHSNRQILHQFRVISDDLHHHSALLLTRLYPDVADAVYLTAMVLLLRQKDGAIAIPWPGGNPGGNSDIPNHQASVLDLLLENLPEIQTGLQPTQIRKAFPEMGDVPLLKLIESGAITQVPSPTETCANAVILLDYGRLYLRRFWRYEIEVAQMVTSRSEPYPIQQPGSSQDKPSPGSTTNTTLSAIPGASPKSLHPQPSGNLTLPANAATLSESILPSNQQSPTHSNSPFGKSESESSHPSPEPNLQDVAVQAGLNFRFTVITGGPGTGKTHSVLMLLIAMLRLNPDLRIVLCAPTGKAAARMMESIQGNLSRINPPSDLLEKIPSTASTIHRLIRWNPSLGKSVYHSENPLPYDIVILDEASMVDVALMSRLARALRPDTRLVLLGDKDQLSSVEAGSVFADIASKQAPNVVRLTKSWRFSEDSEIGQLARCINVGDVGTSWDMLTGGNSVGLLHQSNIITNPEQSGKQGWGTQAVSTPAEKEILYRMLNASAKAIHTKLLDESDHVRAFSLLQDTQILTALRVGPFGSESVNLEIDRRLGNGAVWYEGRPIIATSNNYDLEVYNGDVGLTRYVDNRLMVAFAGSSPGTVRWIAPAQLKSVNSAWALTVHKSQGSEYDQVIFVLPDRTAPVLTRELGYTALTRARKIFRVWGRKPVWEKMISSRVERYSGLAERLKVNVASP